MIRILVTCLVLVPTLCAAQSLPEVYSVTGVQSGDVLNVRSGPGASFEKVGEIAPFDISVEILEQQDGWGRVGIGEGNGWVSMRYLALNPAIDGEIPRPLSCFGTEPFWYVGLQPRGAEAEFLGQLRSDLTMETERVADDGYFFSARMADESRLSVIVKGGRCSDGMSDRDYGMEMLMFRDGQSGSETYRGCCTFNQ